MDDTTFALETPGEQATELASRIRALRLQANLTQADMAKRAGMSSNAYSGFERTGKITLVAYLTLVAILRRSKELAGHLAPEPRPVEVVSRQRARAKGKASA